MGQVPRRRVITEARRNQWRKLARQVLVEGRKLNMAAWEQHFKRLTKDITAFRHVLTIVADPVAEDPDPRELLIWTWCVLIALPAERAQFYQRIPETGEASLESMARELRKRDYQIEGLESGKDNRVRWLGALVRAIEGDLDQGELLPRGSAAWNPSDWIPHDYPCYVVPVDRPFRAEDKKDRARRALLSHALVPRKVGDLDVELLMLTDVNAEDGVRVWTYGAPIFDGLTVDILERGSNLFVVRDAPCANDKEKIVGHIESALRTNCDALVWPELTMSEERLKLVRSELKKGGLRKKGRVPVIVAGSRHVEVAEGGYVNRAELFAGKGQLLGTYDKRRTFELKGSFEDINPGRALTILVAEDRLIGIAICKDFCDDIENDLYHRLGVDVVLVPSMGQASTILAHRRNAKALQSQQGSVTVVVQQVDVVTGTAHPEREPIGYSFAEPSSAGSAANSNDHQNIEFRPLLGRR